MNNLSVFGSSGFIGSHFCELYPDISYKEARENNNPKYDEILYLISTTTNYNIFSNLQIDIDTNLKKLMYVLENCKNRNITFTIISSWFVLGDSLRSPARESDPCSPSGFYSICKKAAEDLLICFCKTFGINYRIIRLSNIFGENDKYSAQKNALSYVCKKIKNNEDVQLYHGGKFFRDYLYVKDAAEAIHFLINNSPKNEIYNVGYGRPSCFLDLVEFCRKETNSTSKFESIVPPDFHKHVQSVRDSWLDTTKINSLGWKPRHDLYESLRKTIKSL